MCSSHKPNFYLSWMTDKVRRPIYTKLSRKSYEESDMGRDLWVEDGFSAGSRVIGGRSVHLGRPYGQISGEGISKGSVTHAVSISELYRRGTISIIQVPEDRYILWELEEQGLEIPNACRMGCCTACTVRTHSGEIYQPEALGISKELKDKGYALLCVGHPKTDCAVEIVTEDEVYDLQFGQYFARQALWPNDPQYTRRDDFAVEIALGDE